MRRGVCAQFRAGQHRKLGYAQATSPLDRVCRHNVQFAIWWFKHPNCESEVLVAYVIALVRMPIRFEIVQQPSRSFDGNDANGRESGFGRLAHVEPSPQLRSPRRLAAEVNAVALTGCFKSLRVAVEQLRKLFEPTFRAARR